MIDINELREAIQTFGSQAINEGDLNELLDRLEAAEKGRDELRVAVCREGDRADAHQVEVLVLRARIEAMGRQEPVAWRTFDGEGGYDYRNFADNENYQFGWNVRNPKHEDWVEPLYLAPDAKGE